MRKYCLIAKLFLSSKCEHFLNKLKLNLRRGGGWREITRCHLGGGAIVTMYSKLHKPIK